MQISTVIDEPGTIDLASTLVFSPPFLAVCIISQALPTPQFILAYLLKGGNKRRNLALSSFFFLSFFFFRVLLYTKKSMVFNYYLISFPTFWILMIKMVIFHLFKVSNVEDKDDFHQGRMEDKTLMDIPTFWQILTLLMPLTDTVPLSFVRIYAKRNYLHRDCV